ncbi:kinase C theta type-like [Pelobates cultripes]|uniref:Kinase C theta type-like n=1 Tax=Pelobates cultripes TaxID=61616 RepID=A0AAD1ST16_PELCU|nr:kinase C theta type-like [Pelobates cultripes]
MRGGKKKKKTSIKKEDGKRKQQQEEEQQWTAVQDQRPSILRDGVSQRRGPGCLSEKDRFFAAEIVCGLQYLHAKGIIHRDLKPENILLDSVGHLKIADFGLALEGMFGRKTATEYAGTPGYIAPEMIQGRRYNCAVDWWAFGVILYKMATGESPFYSGISRHPKQVPNILKETGCRGKQCPMFVTNKLYDMIQIMLLCKIPSRRLGEISRIRLHLFFQSIDWEELEAGRVDPPFALNTPSLDNATSGITQEKAISSLESCKTPIASEDQQLFQGFSFISPRWNIMCQSTAPP